METVTVILYLLLLTISLICNYNLGYKKGYDKGYSYGYTKGYMYGYPTKDCDISNIFKDIEKLPEIKWRDK